MNIQEEESDMTNKRRTMRELGARKKVELRICFLLHSIYCLSSLFRLNICNKTLSINFILKCNDNCKELIQCGVFAPFSIFSSYAQYTLRGDRREDDDGGSSDLH